MDVAEEQVKNDSLGPGIVTGQMLDGEPSAFQVG